MGQQVTLAWDPSSNKDLAGYRVFCREKDQDYDYGTPAWEAEIGEQDKLPNPDEPTCTIYDLDEDTTYYFVARAFDTSGDESGDSNEVCITIFSEAYEVSGQITEVGDAVDGVTVALTGELVGCGMTNRTITSGGGYYSFDVPDGNYTITPSSTTYVFTPPNRAVMVNGADEPNQDFTATWSWSGKIVVDNPEAKFNSDGDWSYHSTSPDRYGADLRYKAESDGSDTATWTPDIPEAGDYNVYAWWILGSSRATNAPYTIYYDGGTETVRANQKEAGSGGRWNYLGTYSFAVGTSGYVVIGDGPDANGAVVADAIKLDLVEIMGISGRITESGAGLDGITVVLTGAMTDSIITSGGGYYSFDVPDGNYTVTPSSSGYEFTPSSIEVMAVGADEPDQDFTATLNWSGEVIIDNPDALIDPEDDWNTLSGHADEYGADLRYKAEGSGSATATWTPDLPEAGGYNVYAWWIYGSSRATNAPYTIYYNGGTETVRANQKEAGTGGQWNLLGTYPFVAGTSGDVVLKDGPDADGVVIADAIKLELQL
jgi:hypothetical protein